MEIPGYDLDHAILSASEERTLIIAHKMGIQHATDLLIKHNVRMVAQSVGKFLKHFLSQADSIPDMFQDGMLGLTEAATKFDLSLDLRFSTYALWWIRQHIRRGLQSNARLIRVPSYIYQTATAVRYVMKKYNVSLYEETMVKLDEDYEERLALAVQNGDIKPKRPKCSETLFNNLTLYMGEMASVESSFFLGSSEDSDSNGILSTLPSNSLNVEEFDQDRVEAILNWLKSCLNATEFTVIQYRLGLGTFEEKSTYDSIGNMIGKSRERVRQIQNESFVKLKLPSNQKTFPFHVDTFEFMCED